jgi:hypothetical protein
LIQGITGITVLRIARGAITPLTHMPALLMATTDLTGSTAASSSARDRGTAVAGAAVTVMAIAAATATGAGTAIGAATRRADTQAARADTPAGHAATPVAA